MAIRNYVGARYVPKFADPIGWQANTSYEAMVIVTYNNSSYTSKIPVPPTVGNPAENSKYWVLTGNYNAQIEEYRQETADAQEHAKDGICAVDEGNNTSAGENHKIGEYFWLNNKLYRATKYISAGDLFSNSNTQETNISEGVYTNYSDITSLKNGMSNNKTNIQILSDNVTGNTNNIYDHVNNRLNPHNVTKAQVGLGNVDNVSKANILLSAYPVGSIYKSTNSTSPAELFGGTWESIEYGRVLVSQGGTYDNGTPMFPAGSTGGTDVHKHAYVVAQSAYDTDIMAGETGVIAVDTPLKDGSGGSYVHATVVKDIEGATDSSNTGISKLVNGKVFRSAGYTSVESNYPPYLAVYMWKRVA